jgi:hypothetical protein
MYGKLMIGIVMLAAFVLPPAFAQQGAVETAAGAMGLPTTWPAGPPREAAPAWAAAGKIRFARWDGGRIETAKAVLSGWPGFNPPAPDLLESMTNWYTPASIPLLLEARINAIWVTFSNGFSIETERTHMEQVKRYIEECHRHGIRVLAYASIANIFWEDMVERVPESKDWVRIGADGKPTPYGAVSYAKVGRVTRYMARISHPGWQDYLRRRVDLALEAGADGIFYDNNFNEALPETYQAIYRHAAARKRDVVLMGNFHQNSYVLNRLTNAVSTEDGLEPGVYAAANVGGRMEKQRATLLPVDGGFLVNNIGLYRVGVALSQGWKPAMTEHGHRETGERFTTPISGPRHQLALAEAAACGGAFQLFSEGSFADGLYRRKPEAMAIWRDIADYNRFLAEHEALYTGARSVARAAVVLDERSEGVPLLNGLAARNVLYDVIYEHDLTAASLRPYAAVALLTARNVRKRAVDALAEYAARGGQLFAVKIAAAMDENGKRREPPAFLARAKLWDALPPVHEIAAALRAAAPSPVKLEAPAGVLHVATAQRSRLLVHLLNYSANTREGVKVTVKGDCKGAAVVTPDAVKSPRTLASGGSCTVELPQLRTYAVVVITEP